MGLKLGSSTLALVIATSTYCADFVALGCAMEEATCTTLLGRDNSLHM